jgi:hypothetical protein
MFVRPSKGVESDKNLDDAQCLDDKDKPEEEEVEEELPKPKPPPTPNKFTNEMVGKEAEVCARTEATLVALKINLRDKQVIFDKLTNEMLRMLGVMERLQTMADSGVPELTEAESNVTICYYFLGFFQ